MSLLHTYFVKVHGSFFSTAPLPRYTKQSGNYFDIPTGVGEGVTVFYLQKNGIFIIFLTNSERKMNEQ